jgi:hypothetical protein
VIILQVPSDVLKGYFFSPSKDIFMKDSFYTCILFVCLQVRVVLKYRHADGNLCIKVTDDSVVSTHFYLLHFFRFLWLDHLFEVIS